MKKLILSLFVLIFAVVVANAQNRTVTGTVIGQDDRQPLPGVSIRLKGSQVGAQTDVSGKYSIQVSGNNPVLVFSFIGYASKEVPAGSSGAINITLASDAAQLGEIVVTANAIKREKKTLGYSAPTLNSSEIMQGQNSSVTNSLAGKIAGVNVTSTSNAPGSSSRVVLRGGSSIAGNNQALIVVDGVPIDNSSVIGGAGSSSTGSASALSSVDFGNRGNDINPDDIASVTVLKGPAAAALYGSRASNGALIITTKTGTKSAKTSITFNTSNAFSSILKLPEFQNEYGQGYHTDIDENGVVSYENDPKENWSWGAPFTGQVQPWGQQIDGVRQEKPYSAVEDNVKDFFKTGFATTNNLSLSGGGDKSTFFLGINSLNSNGINPGNKDTYNKYGVRFNGTTEFSNNFYAGVSVNYSKTNANQVAGGQADGSVYDNLLQTPRDINITGLKDLNNKYNGYGITPADGIQREGQYGYYGAYTLNPYYILDTFDNFDDVSRITGNFNVGYKPASWLDIKERVGIDSYSERRRTLQPKYSFVPADETTNYSADNIQSGNGLYQIDQYNVNEFVHDLMITGTHKFNEDFQGSLMIGNNIRQRYTNTVSSATNASGGLVVPGWYNLANSNGPVNVIADYIGRRRLVGLYADLNLSYKNMLFLEATARNDWSSTLPTANNSFFYPSVSLSFLFTELLKESSITNVLSYGKIRSSYAQVGNDTDPYQLLSTFSRGQINGSFGNTTFPFGNVAALMAGSTIGNADLKPEKTNSFEIGTELGFFKNRLNVDFSYYANKSKNQILSIPTPNSTGYGFRVVNAGEIQNNGVELSLRGTVLKARDFSMELYGTYTKNNSEVVSLLPGISQVSLGGTSLMAIVASVGRPYGEFYGVTNQTDAEGRTIINQATGLPLTTATAQYLGSYNPKYQASLGTNINYKNFSMNLLFDTKHGGVFYSRTKDIMAFNGTSAETGGQRFGGIFPNSVYIVNGETVVNTDVPYSKEDYYPAYAEGNNIVDASYVKLRNMGLSYTFNKEQLKNSRLGGLTVGVFGNNLFIWTPGENKYADPEVNSDGAGNAQGFDFTANPSVRNYGINLKVSF
jgi:TonB-linked SusC/RagA family outer membrane protein